MVVVFFLVLVLALVVCVMMVVVVVVWLWRLLHVSVSTCMHLVLPGVDPTLRPRVFFFCSGTRLGLACTWRGFRFVPLLRSCFVLLALFLVFGRPDTPSVVRNQPFVAALPSLRCLSCFYSRAFRVLLYSSFDLLLFPGYDNEYDHAHKEDTKNTLSHGTRIRRKQLVEVRCPPGCRA